MDCDTAFNRLVSPDHEGEYTDGLSDPGGETKYGISKRSYPLEDIKNLTLERAKEIFRNDFWDKINADKLPNGIAWQVADFAYNSGIDVAIRYLQRALFVADDGHWGPASQAAADKMDEPSTVMRLLSYRLDYMTRLKNWPIASKGWARRIASNLLYGVEDLQSAQKQ